MTDVNKIRHVANTSIPNMSSIIPNSLARSYVTLVRVGPKIPLHHQIIMNTNTFNPHYWWQAFDAPGEKLSINHTWLNSDGGHNSLFMANSFVSCPS